MERIVIVTGAAMGNGFGIASVFAEHGDHVVMLDRDKAVLIRLLILRNGDLRRKACCAISRLRRW